MWHMKSQRRIINSSNFRIIRVSYWCCPTSLLSCAFSINPRWQSPSRSPSPLLGPAAQVSWAVSPHCLLPALAARAAPVEPHLPGATAFPGKQPWILKPVVVSLLFGLHLQKLLQRGGATLPKEDAAASFGVKSGGSGSVLENHMDLGFQVTEIMLGVELWESLFNVQTDCGLHECSIYLLDSQKLWHQ